MESDDIGAIWDEWFAPEKNEISSCKIQNHHNSGKKKGVEMKGTSKTSRLVPDVPMLIGGQWRAGDSTYEVVDPYRGNVVARAPQSNQGEIDDAIEAAVAAKEEMAAMPGFERAALLRRVVEILDERVEDVAQEMTRETGKAIRDARAEVARSKETIRLSAEEAVRIQGEHVPLDSSAMGAGKIAFLLRVPVGVVVGITPYNAPFNLTCHKIAPAIASGNAIILKPPPQSPLVVHRLVEMFVEAGVPKGAVNTVYGDTAGPMLVRDPRIDFITFTGSTRVGSEIKAASGLKRIALELGGNGSTIVHEDADIDVIAPIIAKNSMRLAGQSCISVQNVFAHGSVFDALIERVVENVEALKVGDPLAEDTDVGTVIDEDAASRIISWIDAAKLDGAKVVTGGTRDGSLVQPTVINTDNASLSVVCEEVFGPVVTMLSYDRIDEPIRLINASQYGLQTGIFSKSLEICLYAVRQLQTGGVIINGTSTWRTDQLAYGGVKASGIGREGPHYAIRDMTNERLVLFNL